MAELQKRRSSGRTKTQKSAKVSEIKKKGRMQPREWLRELSTLFLLTSGIVLCLSLVSYSYLVAAGGVIVPRSNIIGPVGHVVATLLVGSLGWVAFFPVAGLFWLAFFRNRSTEVTPRRYHGSILFASAGLLIAALCAVLTIVSGSRGWGGSVGNALILSFSRIMGIGGTVLVCTLVCAVAAAILSQRSVGDVANGLRLLVQVTTKVVVVTAPMILFRTVALAAQSCAQGVVWCMKGVLRLGFARGIKREESRPPLPKPRLRKNSIELVDAHTPAAAEPASERSAAPVLERADPIIVKPKSAELMVLKTGRARSSKSKATEEALSTKSYDEYVMPDINLLTREQVSESGEDDEELRQKAEQIEAKLRDFNIAGRVTQVHPGPVITLFEFEPAAGVKVGRIAALQDDLAMSLKASSIRIIAPIPKRGTVGIEVPNKHQAMVRLRDCLESEAFSTGESILSVPLGKDTYGDAVVVDIAAMPHLLMAGATGTGKSVSINALLLSLLYRAHPAELGLILIDPKVLELSIYDGIPHLRVPVVTDPRQAKAVLSWAVKEMDRRYRFMQRFGVRNIDGYNKFVSGEGAEIIAKENSELRAAMIRESTPMVDADGSGAPLEEAIDTLAIESIAPEQLKPLPKIVIVIDELADLMLTVGREIEELITRLAQKARAAGIHLIVATQRPSVDVITGLIKANFPARLSFRVSSRIDSRTILDSMGAEKLLGKGDMLFMLPGAVPLKRIHGAFVSDNEVQKVVNSLKGQCGPQYDENIIAACEKALREEAANSEGGDGEGGDGDEYDPFYDKAVELVMEKGQASTSMVQRTFRIGYNRAARIIEMMEREGIVGKMDGVKPREILLSSEQRNPGA
jgi:S-DNA-T family DNA segregation ATPase FtsK/SpoIIIE